MVVRRIRDKYTIMAFDNFKVVNEDEDEMGNDTADEDAENMDDTADEDEDENSDDM